MTAGSLDLQRLIRPNILTLTPYRCARDDFSKGILLDANENALGHSIARCPNTTREIDEILNSDLHRYPDPQQLAVKKRIVELRDMPSTDWVFLGVGSDEVIDLLMRITCRPGKEGDSILITPPTYGMYAVCAQINDVDVVKVPLNEGFSANVPKMQSVLAANPKIKLLFLCSPGNPTGTLISLNSVKALASTPNYIGLVVVDEAYIDFAPPNSSAASLVKEYPNIVVLQTLSKSFGLAGIRLGVALAHPSLVTILSNAKAPYNISSPTSTLALRAFSPTSTTLREEHINTLIMSRGTLASSLDELSNIGMGKPIGGNNANFLLIPILDKATNSNPDSVRAKAVYLKLAESKGVVVRYRGGEMHCEGCLRITVGTEAENTVARQRLGEVLREI